ncbi:hypothetical protein C0W80_01150 [Photobacterium leiognathi subsp. mandapamensis]|uniref:EAL domain-containing protein n=1 Tax=Photobacterium leiognathi TaxID=553611 RepID=UPI000D1557BF|nr:EAL domain-containing protein [Photobacterium leiognathi]PSV04340.1 hypothetical protein C0W80_01150 [Photobacterium leiognathi subsp. mandapamensis]
MTAQQTLTTVNDLYRYIQSIVPSLTRNNDDAILLDAFEQNDLRHVCQAIRETISNQVTYQHLTLRFGSNSEQSVYQFDVSKPVQFLFDLYSLYLAIRHIEFQLCTFHKDVINPLVVPINSETLSWPIGQSFINQVYQHHASAMKYIIPCVQLHDTENNECHNVMTLNANLESLKKKAVQLWVDIIPPTRYLETIRTIKPDAIKTSHILNDDHKRSGLIPVIRFIRKNNTLFIAGRVGSQHELNQYRLLGAQYYFGYISDIPVSVSMRKQVANNS